MWKFSLSGWCAASWLSPSPGRNLLSWPLLAHGTSQSTPHDDFCVPEPWKGFEPSLSQDGKVSWDGFLPSKGPFVLPAGVSAQTIHQWPPTRVQPAGSPLSLECTVKGTSSPELYWYRQEAGGSLQLLFYSLSAEDIDPKEFQNFEASRPQDGQFILSSKKLQLNNSGFYLCAWSLTLSWVGQTSVQKPHPHHPLQQPSLRD